MLLLRRYFRNRLCSALQRSERQRSATRNLDKNRCKLLGLPSRFCCLSNCLMSASEYQNLLDLLDPGSIPLTSTRPGLEEWCQTQRNHLQRYVQQLRQRYLCTKRFQLAACSEGVEDWLLLCVIPRPTFLLLLCFLPHHQLNLTS